MSNLAKLSKQAQQLEQDRHYAKALVAYTKLFEETRAAQEDVDVALYNRAGDVAMRAGDPSQGVTYYERAIDGYAAGGLLNNAIAVSNKLLRHDTDNAAAHYTLAVLHAKQGFRGDARHHYVEYAERMHRAGRDDEASRALTEFAALCAPGDDARAALAAHLKKGSRGAELAARLDAMLASTAPTDRSAPPSAAGASAPPPSSARGAASDASLVFLDVTRALDAPIDDDESLALDARALSGSDIGSVAIAGFDTTSLASDGAFPSLALEPLGDTIADASVPFEDDAVRLLSFEPAAFVPPDSDALTFQFIGEPLAHADEGPDSLDLLDWAPDEVVAPPSVEGWDGAASGIVALDAMDDVADVAMSDVMNDAIDGVIDDTPAGRHDRALPGELPPLALVSWIGSASSAIGESVAEWQDTEAPVATEQAAGSARSLDEGTATSMEEPATVLPAGGDLVDLGAWLRSTEPAPCTRFTTEQDTPTGDETADFARLLGAFRSGVARTVDDDDHASHYDLGIAFREMGLVDEAIAQFQRAVRADAASLRAREALGQCFLDREAPQLAIDVLVGAGASAGQGGDQRSMLGVMYLLGDAHARLGRADEARDWFRRVVAIDIDFRDAIDRLLSDSTP